MFRHAALDWNIEEAKQILARAIQSQTARVKGWGGQHLNTRQQQASVKCGTACELMSGVYINMRIGCEMCVRLESWNYHLIIFDSMIN